MVGNIDTAAATVMITGSNGFIGGHVRRLLDRERRFVALPATRDGRGGTRRLDLTEPRSFPAALRGVDAVVHCGVGDRRVTVDGTAALLKAAAEAGVRRVVYLSSIAVYGDAAERITESAPLLPANGRGYGAWKSAAEQICEAETALEVVRLRPSIVYGPGSTLWVALLARRILSGRWGVLGRGGEGFCNLVHVDDVVAAIVAALEAPGAAGMALNVNGPEVLSWNAWFARLGEAIGAPRLQTISPSRLRARSILALPVKAAARVRPGLAARWLLGAPSASEISLFARRAIYPADAARVALGWQPRISIEDGLASSVAWLRQNGLCA